MGTNSKVYENRPTLFANNWDRFGGRALDILNCFFIAQKLQINFKFFWPYNSFFSQDDPHLRFFSQDFQDMYRVETDLDPRSIQIIDLQNYTLPSAKSFVGSIDSMANLGIANFMSLPRFLDENEENCTKEYADHAHLAMSIEVRNAIDEIDNSETGWITIHGRYGDLIDGDFKQYVPKTKYVNTLVYRNFIEQPQNNAVDIRFLSDSTSVVEGLEKIAKRNLSSQFDSQQLIDTFAKDSRDFIDLLIMANSDFILAPNSSAYSILASRIGGTKILDFQSSLHENTVLEILELDIDKHYEHFSLQIRGNLKARDLINFLQNHYKSLDFSTVLKLSNYSYSADSEYVYAACIWSAIQFLLGEKHQAKIIMAHAEEVARSVMHVHHDPLAVLLVTKFCLSVFETKDANLFIMSELSELKTYQFSTIIAIGYLENWNWRRGLEMRQANTQSHLLRFFTTLTLRVKIVALRKFLLSRTWKTLPKDTYDEFLFSILDLFVKI